MEGANICGLATEPACPSEVTVEKVEAFSFLVWFLDNVADLIQKSTQPVIEVNLMQHKENSPLQVILRPVAIDDISVIEKASRRFSVTIDVFTSETVADKAFALLLTTARVCLSVVHTVSKRKGFVYVPQFQIMNLGHVQIRLNITKTI